MKKEAVFLLSGYIMSYLGKENIIKWADNKILQSVNNELIFDLSLSYNNEANIISTLNKLYEKDTITGIDICYFSLYRELLKKKKLEWKVVAEEMSFLYKSNLVEKDDKFFFSSLIDYFGLLRDGFTGNMRMPRDLIEFLSNYDEDIAIFKELDFNVRGVRIAEL